MPIAIVLTQWFVDWGLVLSICLILWAALMLGVDGSCDSRLEPTQGPSTIWPRTGGIGVTLRQHMKGLLWFGLIMSVVSLGLVQAVGWCLVGMTVTLCGLVVVAWLEQSRLGSNQ